ncbi:hypothetical protein C8J57DRAFT_1524201 [Mycena rebaudengoi]|nr:hypothetical protein C8J57DRAFT_1524201 [Mycena rebaudengoi]
MVSHVSQFFFLKFATDGAGTSTCGMALFSGFFVIAELPSAVAASRVTAPSSTVCVGFQTNLILPPRLRSTGATFLCDSSANTCRHTFLIVGPANQQQTSTTLALAHLRACPRCPFAFAPDSSTSFTVHATPALAVDGATNGGGMNTPESNPDAAPWRDVLLQNPASLCSVLNEDFTGATTESMFGRDSAPCAACPPGLRVVARYLRPLSWAAYRARGDCVLLSRGCCASSAGAGGAFLHGPLAVPSRGLHPAQVPCLRAECGAVLVGCAPGTRSHLRVGAMCAGGDDGATLHASSGGMLRAGPSSRRWGGVRERDVVLLAAGRRSLLRSLAPLAARRPPPLHCYRFRLPLPPLSPLPLQAIPIITPASKANSFVAASSAGSFLASSVEGESLFFISPEDFGSSVALPLPRIRRERPRGIVPRPLFIASSSHARWADGDVHLNRLPLPLVIKQTVPPKLTSDVIPLPQLLDGAVYNISGCTYNVTRCARYTGRDTGGVDGNGMRIGECFLSTSAPPLLIALVPHLSSRPTRPPIFAFTLLPHSSQYAFYIAY